MTLLINLIGQQFGRLTVLNRADRESKATYWNCLCGCGKSHIVAATNLVSGTIKSCGCLRIEKTKMLAQNNIKHGESSNRSKEYKAWLAMKERCSNSNHTNYKDYGGRGIIICQRWIDNYKNFLFDMGRCPKGFTIDRINNDGNYEPLNCHWVNWKTQLRNRRGIKLSMKLANEIRQLHNNGIKQIILARTYKVSKPCISQLINCHTWI